jgi:hypothetical protein
MLSFASPWTTGSPQRSVPSSSRCTSTARRHARVCARLTFSDVQAAAAERGVIIANSGAGPFLNLRATRTNGKAAGVLTAALLPGRRVHIESYKARARTPDGALLHLSPGMFLFIAAIAFGSERGYDEVYGLAIDDEPQQHARLVAYLKRFGGAAVRRVGGSKLRDIPDRLLYGGRGTIIRGDIPKMLNRAEGMISRTRKIVEPLLRQS